jgi:hypothetical protein
MSLAPRDGRKLLLYATLHLSNESQCLVGRYKPAVGWVVDRLDEPDEMTQIYPTHWMELPDKP